MSEYTNRMTAAKMFPAYTKPKQYCQGVPARQFNASSWGDANRGCERIARVVIDGEHFCNLHADPRKRYGVNATRIYI